MDTPTVQSPFAQLPDLMQQILLHDENIDLNIAIMENNHLSETERDKMIGVIRKMILKTITPAELVNTVKRDIGLDDARTKKLALDLLQKRFLPMEWYLGSVQGLIHELGGNVSEALAEAKRNFPEVYKPHEAAPVAGELGSDEHALLRNFEDRVGTMKGKAEILLRLTGLSVQVEQGVQQNRISQTDGEHLMRDLDSVSYAVNTKDLDPFEINSLKRKIRKILKILEPGA